MEENKITNFEEVTEDINEAAENTNTADIEIHEKKKNPITWFNGLSTWKKVAVIATAGVGVGAVIFVCKKAGSKEAVECVNTAAEAAIEAAPEVAQEITETVVETVTE